MKLPPMCSPANAMRIPIESNNPIRISPGITSPGLAYASGLNGVMVAIPRDIVKTRRTRMGCGIPGCPQSGAKSNAAPTRMEISRRCAM